MKQVLLFMAGIMLLSNKGTPQSSFYDFIEAGKFEVDYCDTIIYNDSIAYDQFG